MQVYNRLPLLTAQPSDEDRQKAPHLLYGVLEAGDPCSAARWRGMALEEIEKLLSDGKTPVIAGGTGFYITALLDGLSPVPDVPGGVREKIAAMQKEMGNPAFHAAFAEIDPVMAAKLDPYNTQRVVRAWEVLEGTGKSLAEWQALPRETPPAHLKFFTITLLPPREKLHAQCDARFDAMIKAGAPDEARAFMDDMEAGRIPKTAALANALGYPELAAHLQGRDTLEHAAELAKISTRQYAKRQSTWFRNQITPDLRLETADVEAVLRAI